MKETKILIHWTYRQALPNDIGGNAQTVPMNGNLLQIIELMADVSGDALNADIKMAKP